MALHLGDSSELKIMINNVPYRIAYLTSTTELIADNILMSSDSYIFADSNGFYFTIKEVR